jgi:3-methyladenine DNA glycosylase AlkD
MERWAADFRSWDLCDQCCGNLFWRTPLAYEMVETWSSRDEEYVKRGSFSLLAYLAVHDKRAPDERFIALLPLIRRAADDDRNYVKKAVNWALRSIGKRNATLATVAIAEAQELAAASSRAARWIGTDALRELTSQAVQERLARKKR